MKLAEYHKKRHFDRTPEPRGKERQPSKGWRFVIQKHDATRLHYDFRLELDGVLKSWAVPKGPSLDPADKRLAVHVEDHPVEYGTFEGVIPEGEYGGGPVLLWDRGTWTPQGDARADYAAGRMKFELHGQKLKGSWALFRTRSDGRQDQWLLVKHRDEHAVEGEEPVVDQLPLSVASGRSIEEIAEAGGPTWQSSRASESKAKPTLKQRVKALKAAAGKKVTKKAPAKKKTSARMSAAAGAVRSEASGGEGPGFGVGAIPGARAAAMPRTFAPQLATLREDVPKGEDWLHEIKFDGYRLIALVKQGSVRLLTRSGLDWTPKFANIAGALQRLPVDECILDGEAVVLDAQGRSSFQLLQNQLKGGGRGELAMYCFDIVHCNGYSLIDSPLIERKRLLQRVLAAAGYAGHDPVRYTDHLQGSGQPFFEKACELGLEGIICKRADSPYRSARTHDWYKAKCHKRQEFVVVGYTDPEGSRTAFGSLLLGYHDNGNLKYCGRVGTGFTEKSLKDLYRKMEAMAVDEPPVVNPPRELRRRGHWIAPKLVAEVEFTEWTDDGRLRHPAFMGLREDKAPQLITREEPETQPMPRRATTAAKTARPEVAGVTITHPDRVLYPPDITKLAIAQYYDAVGPHILPHIIDRPLAVVRCPQGQTGKCFFQKNVRESLPDAIVGIPVEESDGPATYIGVKDHVGLISLIQFGVLEIHPWGSRADKQDQPDRVIFDLDPAPDVKWERVKEAAVEVRERLKKLDLVSFIKTTGGKGLHVVVPLVRRANWDAVKEFAHEFADQMVRDSPTAYVSNMAKSKRTGRIFVDYLRNGKGATAIAPYSTRARAGAPVSTPITWDELAKVGRGDAFTIENVPARLAKLPKDPWEKIDLVKQSLTAAMRRAVGR